MNRQRKIFLTIGCLLLAFAIVFLCYALQHPEASFPWSNSITYTIYCVYLLVDLLAFVLAALSRNKRK